jgi:hypothetical protein
MHLLGWHRNNFVVACHGCLRGVPESDWCNSGQVDSESDSDSTADANMFRTTGLLTVTASQFAKMQSLLFHIGDVSWNYGSNTTPSSLTPSFQGNPRVNPQRANLAPLLELHPRRWRQQDLLDHCRLGEQQRVRTRLHRFVPSKSNLCIADQRVN